MTRVTFMAGRRPMDSSRGHALVRARVRESTGARDSDRKLDLRGRELIVWLFIHSVCDKRCTRILK